MAGPPDPLVSVIVPAFNAAATIDETLRSIRAQTYRALEVLVVDDGSSDETPAIVQRHAAEDPRVRLIRQDNAGVAAARNNGLRQAGGDLVAPVDADDLWSPGKIERQVERLRQAGDAVALVYTWFALIDEEGRVISKGRPGPTAEGRVLARMCRGNLPGNGSSPLMRRDAVLAAGGYDETLRARGVQGCEDLELYLALAERGEFACVADFLTGYRLTRGNMSGDADRMLASFDTVVKAFLRRHPHLEADCRQGRVEMVIWLYLRALRAGRFGAAARLIARLMGLEVKAALRLLLRTPIELVDMFVLGPRRRGGRRFAVAACA